MPAAIKNYKVKVRVVPFNADAFDVSDVEASASNAWDAKSIAESKVKRNHPDARAIVAISHKKVA
jgi:hypothetical protein